jgi:hypothetical protein
MHAQHTLAKDTVFRSSGCWGRPNKNPIRDESFLKRTVYPTRPPLFRVLREVGTDKVLPVVGISPGSSTTRLRENPSP